MAETASMRVVPSGKVYRQMFDAQVQLKRSLTKLQSRGDTVTRGTERQSTAGYPVVRLSKEELAHGLLTERQRTWADGFPNDPYVENPVLHKQYSEFVNARLKESESSKAGREVRGLPDVVVPAKEGSNIIDRIAASRKDRHDASVEDMHQELSVINAELEPLITEYSDNLLKHMEEDDKEIDRLLARIETNEDLLTYDLEALHKLWEEVQAHSSTRQTWIADLDQQLTKAEDDRMDLVKKKKNE